MSTFTQIGEHEPPPSQGKSFNKTVTDFVVKSIAINDKDIADKMRAYFTKRERKMEKAEQILKETLETLEVLAHKSTKQARFIRERFAEDYCIVESKEEQGDFLQFVTQHELLCEKLAGEISGYKRSVEHVAEEQQELD